MASTDAIFDVRLVRHRLARAMAQGPADFLLARAIEDIIDRLGTVRRHFRRVADLATPSPDLAIALAARLPDADVIRLAPLAGARNAIATIVGSPEALPFAGGFDLAVSALALQTTNDLPGTLVQIRRALVPDGLFLATLVGGRSLVELRTVLTEAEAELAGGASPRVAPFADVRDMGGLLQRAGFALPVADSTTIVVRYDSLFALMADLRAMGATNALLARSRRPAPRALFLRAAARYAARFADPDGRIRATFEFIAVSGWAPHESQQKPAKRGSATISLVEALGARDKPASTL